MSTLPKEPTLGEAVAKIIADLESLYGKGARVIKIYSRNVAASRVGRHAVRLEFALADHNSTLSEPLPGVFSRDDVIQLGTQLGLKRVTTSIDYVDFEKE